MAELPEDIDRRFRYVLLVSKRAEQLIQGSVPKLRSRHAKATRIAMDEVEGKLLNWQPTPPPMPVEEPVLDLEEPVTE